MEDHLKERASLVVPKPETKVEGKAEAKTTSSEEKK